MTCAVRARIRLVALGCALAVLATTAGAVAFASGYPPSRSERDADAGHGRATTSALERARPIERAPVVGTRVMREEGRLGPVSQSGSRVISDEAPARLRVQHILGGYRSSVVAAADGRHVYVGVGARIEVLRVPPVGDPIRVFETPPLVTLLRENVFDLEREGDRLVATIDGRLIVLDLADPLRPVVMAELLIGRNALSLDVMGRFAAVLDGTDAGGVIVDLAAEDGPTVIAAIDVPGFEGDLAFAFGGRLLYVLGGSADGQSSGVPWVVDLEDPASPRVVGSLDVSGAGALAVDDESGLLWIVAAGSRADRAGVEPEPTWLRAYDLAGTDPRLDPGADAGAARLLEEIRLKGKRVHRLRAEAGLAYLGTWTWDTPVGRVGSVHVVGRNSAGTELAQWGHGEGPGQPRDFAVLGDGRLVAVHDLGLSVWGPAVEESGGDGISAPLVMNEQGRLGGPGWWKQVATIRDKVYLGVDYALQVVDVGGEVPQTRGFIFELGDRRNLMNGRGKGMALDGGRVIMANRDADIVHVLDVSDPDAPRETGRFISTGTTRFFAEAIAARDGLAFLAPMTDPLLVLDVADPAAPTVAGFLAGEEGVFTAGGTIALGPKYAYVAGSYLRNAVGRRIAVVDVHRRAGPALLATLEVPGDRPQVEGLAVSGDVLVASVEATAGGRLMVADISDPHNPHWLSSSADIGSEPLVLAYHPPWVYTIGWPNGLSVFDLSDPSLPREVARLPDVAGANAFAVGEDGRIYVAAGAGGLVTVAFSTGGEGEAGDRDPRVLLPWVGRSYALGGR